MNPNLSTAPEGYADWLAELKTEIFQRRQRAALAVNAELIGLYARIGHDILERQQQLGWGAKVIDRLARDLKAHFPDMRGFSSRNLKYMAYFAEHCPTGQFGQQLAAQIGHWGNVLRNTACISHFGWKTPSYPGRPFANHGPAAQ